jgi:hypothetical protein
MVSLEILTYAGNTYYSWEQAVQEDKAFAFDLSVAWRFVDIP